MSKRYRVMFSSRQDFKKTMALLALAIAMLDVVAGFVVLPKVIGAYGAVAFVAVSMAVFVWIVCKTELVEYEK